MNKKAISKLVLSVMIALTALFVLFYSSVQISAELSQTNITVMYAVCGMLALGAVLSLMLLGELEISFIDILALIYFGVITACAIINKSVDTSPIEYAHIFMLACFYLSLKMALSAFPHTIKTILFVGICSLAVYEALVGLGQLLGHSASRHSLFSITGTFLNPGPFGGYLAVIGSVAVAYAMKYRTIFSIAMRCWVSAVCVIASVVAVLLCLIVIPATLSRAAILAFAVAAFTAAFSLGGLKEYLINLFFSHKGRFFLLIGISIVMLGAVGTGAYMMKKKSADGRKLIADVSLSTPDYKDEFMGKGLGNFAGPYGVEQAEHMRIFSFPEEMLYVAGCPEHAFNEYLEVWVEAGTMGIVSFVVLMFFTVFFTVFLFKSPFGYGILAFAIFALFSYPLSILPFRLLMVLLFALCAAQFPENSCYSLFSDYYSKTMRVIMSSIVVAAIAAGAIFMPSQFKELKEKTEASIKWQKSAHWYRSENYDYAVEEYKELYPTLAYNPRFMFEYGYALSKVGDYDWSNIILEDGACFSSDPMFYNIMANNYKAQKLYKYAEGHYKKAYWRLPNRIYPLYLLTKLYYETGNATKFKEMAGNVISFKPKVNSQSIDELKREIQKLLDSGYIPPSIEPSEEEKLRHEELMLMKTRFDPK